MSEPEINSHWSWHNPQTLIVAGTAMACALLLVSPRSSGLDAIAAKLAFTGLLALIAIQDWRTHTVSPAITVSWMVASLLRAAIVQDALFIPFWACIFCVWVLRIYGGGDAKLLMGLFGLWPDLRFVWVTSAVVLTVGLPIVIWKYARISPRVLASGIGNRIASGALLPTNEDLNRGTPFAFTYCIAAVLFLWVVK